MFDIAVKQTNTTFPGYSLFLVFVFGMVILYIYALIAFALYRDIFDAATGHYCSTFYECMVTALHRGLIDGMYNVSRPNLS